MCPKCGRPYGKRRRCYLCERKKRACSVPGCLEPYEARGWCGKHYQRLRAHGDPLAFHPNAKRKPFIRKRDGYVVIPIPGGQKLEHRLVVERAYGRPLRTNEQVHHINGDKADNRIENLLVLSNTEHQTLHHELGTHPQSVSRRVKLTCLRCGKAYERSPSKVAGSRYCSSECRMPAMWEAHKLKAAARRR